MYINQKLDEAIGKQWTTSCPIVAIRFDAIIPHLTKNEDDELHKETFDLYFDFFIEMWIIYCPINAQQ